MTHTDFTVKGEAVPVLPGRRVGGGLELAWRDWSDTRPTPNSEN